MRWIVSLFVVALFLPVVLGDATQTKVSFFGAADENVTFDYYETITIYYLKQIVDQINLSDYFRVDRWNTTLGAWQSYKNYNVTLKPDLSWQYETYDPGDLDLTDNYAPVAAFRAGMWSWNATASAYIAYYLKEFYVRRPDLAWATNQLAYKYGSYVRFRFRGSNWLYWRDYYYDELNWLDPTQCELICELVVTSYPTMFELVPGQQIYLYNDSRSPENRDIVGSLDFTIPNPGSLGTLANLTIFTFRTVVGSHEVFRTVLYTENITLVSRAIFGSVAEESAQFFGISSSMMIMGVALSGVVVMTIFVGSVMKFSGPGYGIIMLMGILFITALGWFDVWFASISIVIVLGFMYFTAGESGAASLGT